jgi:hypothetical protein
MDVRGCRRALLGSVLLLGPLTAYRRFLEGLLESGTTASNLARRLRQHSAVYFIKRAYFPNAALSSSHTRNC